MAAQRLTPVTVDTGMLLAIPEMRMPDFSSIRERHLWVWRAGRARGDLLDPRPWP